MFGNKRRRAMSSPSLNGSNANPSAATAAAQAFLKNQASNASLASAAAGAALRSRPTTPISVADVQTKRMIRRSGSTSSVGSSVAGPTKPTLERRGSNGSMSERTFRDPSPSRGVPSAPDAPPVPAIPTNISQSKAHRRATSMEAPAMRVSSPPPNKSSGRGSSLGPGATSTSPRQTGQKTSNLSIVHELTGTERPASRGSVNFSYPTSCSRPTSPVSQKRLTSPSPSRTNTPRITSPANQNLVYDPNTRSFLPYAEILAIEQRIHDAANQSIKQKKRIAPAQATGKHLSNGTVGGRPRGTAVDAMEAAAQEKRQAEREATVPNTTAPTPASRTLPGEIPVSSSEYAIAPTSPTSVPAQSLVPKKKKKRVVVATDSDSDQASFALNSSDNDSEIRPTVYKSRAGALLTKKPSIVREDREAEEEEISTPRSLQNGVSLNSAPRTISPIPLPGSSAGRSHGKGQASASAAYAEERQHTRSASQPAPAPPTAINTNGSLRGTRVQSVSPARTTHFAATPDSLVVKHHPPPRSISPRKSAMKRSNSPRGSSPAGELPRTFGISNRMSVSESSNEGSEDVQVPRRKTARVSFDESNVIVGEAAPQASTDSPVAPSPQQTKRGWFSLGSRGKKKDTSAVEEEDDEFMQPRPALPSFGSVRERKNNREPLEERQLVKPAAPVDPTDSDGPNAKVPASISPTPASPLFTSVSGNVVEFPIGQSNDHIVGGILSQDAASKNAANISKSREPLPPQVLSVEGSGYHSDTDSTVSSFDFLTTSDVGAITASEISPGFEIGEPVFDQTPPENATPQARKAEEASKKSNGDIPQVSFTQPTPTLEADDERRKWPDMPGGFPDANLSSETGSQLEEVALPLVNHRATDPTPSDRGISEPYECNQPGSPVLGEIASKNHVQHSTIEEETEDESIYSDAAEDFSDTDGDGFMSLNAVVESPIAPSAIPGLSLSTPPDSPTAPSTKVRAYKMSQLSRKSSEPEVDQSWEKAREYWRGLSAEKKSQVEQEARDEAGDSDATIEAKPLPKPKKKKKGVAASPDPIEVTLRQQPSVRQDRTYMIQPGAKVGRDGSHPVIRSSMRAEAPEPTPETHIRKSMRGQGSMRASLRGSDPVEPRGPTQKSHRPVALPASQIMADPNAVKMHVRALSVASASVAAKKNMATPNPTLQRKDSSDSDTSFKRTRPAGGSHFKSSMRRPSIDKPTDGRARSPLRSGRFSMRSLSPTGSANTRLPFNSAQPQTHVRNSMRSSYDSGPTLRTSKPERAKSPIRILGFGRPSSTKPAEQKPVRQRASRFADSSDEDEGTPAFRSRFGDSSDDDDDIPTPSPGGMRDSMRPNQADRSLPRQAGVVEGDSSDLPDSDDEKSPRSPGMKLAKSRPNGIANSRQGLALVSGSLRRSGSGRETLASPTTATIGQSARPKQNRRGSFMSILRRKKSDPDSKVRKVDIESAARRDTPLERSRSDLQALKRGESYQLADDVRPSSPKLQKRNNSGSWPLPVSDSHPKIVGGEDGRPSSADAGEGLVGGELTNGKEEGVARPDLGARRFTATGLADVDLSTVTGKGRKKKKFQKLRNLFGLDD